MQRKSNIMVALALGVFAFPILGLGQAIDPATGGKIQFDILMPNDVLVPNLAVFVEGANYRKEVVISADAIDAMVNSIAVPVGIYRVSSRNGIYYKFERAPFRVRAGTVTKINVFPLLRLRAQMLLADGTDRYEFAPAPKYDSFAVAQGRDPALSILIRYDRKRRAKGSITYSSNVSEFRGSLQAFTRGVMLTYDALALYADKVRFDPKNLVLHAEGNVVIEDGRQRSRAKTLVLQFKDVPEIIALEARSP